MLGQVISKSIRAFVSKDGFATSKALPFGTIVFVVSLGPAGEAKIIHEDMIYRVPAGPSETTNTMVPKGRALLVANPSFETNARMDLLIT
jgi:hypothetical protein